MPPGKRRIAPSSLRVAAHRWVVIGGVALSLLAMTAQLSAGAGCDGGGVAETLARARAECCPARNHGAYVSCAAHVCNRAVAAGSLQASCKVGILKADCAPATTTSSTHPTTTTTSTTRPGTPTTTSTTARTTTSTTRLPTTTTTRPPTSTTTSVPSSSTTSTTLPGTTSTTSARDRKSTRLTS